MKPTRILYTVLLLLLGLILPTSVWGQTAKPELTGWVLQLHSDHRLPFVSLVLENEEHHKIHTLTDTEGRFQFKELPTGSYRLTASCIGYQSQTRLVDLTRDRTVRFHLQPDSHTLNDVVVTASESRGITSTSRIDRKAMEHLQPSCFTDLLALIPGGKTRLPALTQANTIRLRETGESKGDYSFSSLGTLFVTDGIPISPNSNMQEVRQASSGYTGDSDAGRNHTSRGIDMRTISTDNIESVEIIRGIAPAEYGDLTSGVVLINRKLKATPWEARFKADPYSKLFYVGKGFELDERAFVLNASLDYLDAKRDPRNKMENYKRLTGSLRMQKVWQNESGLKLRWKSALDYTGSFDNDKHDPEILKSKDDRYTSSYNQMGMSHSLALLFPRPDFLKSIHLDVAATCEASRIEQTRLVSLTRDQIASVTLEEGEHDGLFLPYHYLADVTVDGKPLTAFARLKALLAARTTAIQQIFTLGTEWKADKNFGRGQVYDPARPLMPGTPYRPRSYRDLRGQQQLSAFLQDHLHASIGAHTLEVSAGLRALTLVHLPSNYDLRGKLFLDPRLNLQWKFPALRLGRQRLYTYLSGGYGQQTKFPTLLYLYPDKVYHDLVQLNYYHTNPAYRRVNLLTTVVDPTNRQLQPARNHKWEVRWGATLSGHQLAVTWFREETRTGFRSTSCVRPYSYKDYDESAIDPQLTHRPELDDLSYRTDTILGLHSQVTNGSRLRKEGLEFQYSSNRIPLLQTRFTVNGAWFRTTCSNSQPMVQSVSNKMIGHTPISDKYLGFYETEDGTVYQSFQTNFMADTYLPKLGLAFSLTAECTWMESTRQLYRDGTPLGYIDVTGQTHPFTEADLHHPYRQWLVQKFNPDMFRTRTVPFYAYFNLKVTKNLGKALQLALFVDRILDYLPDYQTESGLTVRRTARPYFGIELNFTL